MFRLQLYIIVSMVGIISVLEICNIPADKDVELDFNGDNFISVDFT